MSSLESFELDLILKEERESRFTRKDGFNLDEFVGQLQDALHFAKKNLDKDLVFIAIEKTFKEYYNDVDLAIK